MPTIQPIQSVKLKDITSKIGSGATPRGGKNSYITEGIALIRSLNVYDFSFAYEGLAFIDEKQASQLENVLVERDDILLNITGASVCRCCLVPQNVLPARVNQHVSIVRIKPRAADARYVLYAINSPYNKRRLLAIAQGGATREALTKEKIENFEIPTPPLPTQEKIAAILSAYDDLIENNLRRIEILEEMAQTIYREWFVKFRFPGYQKVKMVDSPMGKIPEGWKVISLDEIMDFQGGAQPPRAEWSDEPAIGFIRMIQIRDYQSDNYVCYVKDSDKLRKCVRQDIMIARYGASVARICWGLEGAYNVALVKVIPLKTHYREYFRTYLQSETFQALLIGMSGRTAQAGFNKSNLKSIPLPFPVDDLIMDKYQNLVEPLRLLELTLQEKNRTLRQTRDLLLPKLISGELDVSELDISIPEANA